MKTLGERVRELRNELDLSLRELARKLGVSAAFLSDLELGRRYPSDELLKKLARTLKVGFEDLKEHDLRPPVDQIRKRASQSPAFGFMMRRVVEEDVSAEELEDALARVLKERRRKGKE